jgi:SAM-dependent methyltransferase
MWFGDLWTAYRKDRRFLVRELIPAVGRRGGKVLFIGRRYTKHYPALLAAQGVECWTIDIDPIAARWGAPERHVIGDILDEPDHWPASSFDTIILNGVFGFGLNSERDQDAALRACRLLLTKDGWLVLGWNTDRCIDPSELPTFRNHFRCSSFRGLASAPYIRQIDARLRHLHSDGSRVNHSNPFG